MPPKSKRKKKVLCRFWHCSELPTKTDTGNEIDETENESSLSVSKMVNEEMRMCAYVRTHFDVHSRSSKIFHSAVYRFYPYIFPCSDRENKLNRRRIIIIIINKHWFQPNELYCFAYVLSLTGRITNARLYYARRTSRIYKRRGFKSGDNDIGFSICLMKKITSLSPRIRFATLLTMNYYRPIKHIKKKKNGIFISGLKQFPTSDSAKRIRKHS